MLSRRKSLPTTRFRPTGRGPLVGLGTRRLERRRSGVGWRSALVPLTLAAAAASWVLVIGPDLRPEAATRVAKPALSIAAPTPAGGVHHHGGQRPAGPGGVTAPQLAPVQPLPNSLQTHAPISHALLSAARDHVARGVHAAWGSVPDLEAVKGADVDLVERGLHLANFPLREAIVRHRFKAPRRYGLRRRPQASPANSKRALTTKTLRVFLDRFAEQLPTRWDGGSGDSYRAGDLVLVQVHNPRARQRRQMFAVVSDRSDANGVSLLITLDPREGVARERNVLSAYQVLRHFRLAAAQIADIRQTLNMPPRARRGRLL